MTLTGNKGEWSELYVLLVLISSGRLELANADLTPSGAEYEVVGVSRSQADGQVEYVLDFEGSSLWVRTESAEEKVDIAELDPAIKTILHRLKVPGSSSVEVPEIETLMTKLRVQQLSARSSAKSDLAVLVKDKGTGEILRLEFSIKSQLGSPSTLLNASGATNFRLTLPYESQFIPELKEMDGKPGQIVARALECFENLSVPLPTNKVFESNLMLVDSQMPVIVGAMLLGYYSGVERSIPSIVDWVATRDPLRMSLGSKTAAFYEFKVKTMLSDFALAMFPGKPWDGTYTADGGYVIVDSDGRLSCFPSVQRDVFREYLYLNTRLETASTKRHGFGVIHVDDAAKTAYVDLNLQIRFRM